MDAQGAGCCSVHSYLMVGHSCYVALMLIQSVLKTLKPLFVMLCLLLPDPGKKI